jgi:hypothetical protein
MAGAGFVSCIRSGARDCCDFAVNVNCFILAKICLVVSGNERKTIGIMGHAVPRIFA